MADGGPKAQLVGKSHMLMPTKIMETLKDRISILMQYMHSGLYTGNLLILGDAHA